MTEPKVEAPVHSDVGSQKPRVPRCSVVPYPANVGLSALGLHHERRHILNRVLGNDRAVCSHSGGGEGAAASREHEVHSTSLPCCADSGRLAARASHGLAALFVIIIEHVRASIG